MLHAPLSHVDARFYGFRVLFRSCESATCACIQAVLSDAVQDREPGSNLKRGIGLESRNIVGGRVHTPQSCAGCIVARVGL